MKTNVSLFLVLALAFFSMANALVLHRKVNQNHLAECQNHQASSLVHDRIAKLMHLDANSDEQQIDMNGPAGDFFMWMMSDKDVIDSAANRKPLQDKTSEKIRKYLADHPEIVDSFIYQSQKNGETVDCLNKLNRQQKKKFYGWILDEIDFKNMFLDESDFELEEEQVNKLTERAMNDPELGKAFSSCGTNTQPSRL